MIANVEDVTVVNVKYRGEPLAQDAGEIVMYGAKHAEDVVCVRAPMKAVIKALAEYAQYYEDITMAGETLTEYLKRRLPTTSPPMTVNVEVDEDGHIVEED